MAYKLDIFALLAEIDRKNINYYDTLSDEEQKGFQPFVVMRWLSGTKDSGQVCLLNEITNRYIFNLSNHKGLLYRLLTVCTSGKTKRYAWMKALPRKGGAFPMTISVLCDYYQFSKRYAVDALSVLSDETILEHAEFLGRQAAELTKIKTELKARNNG